ncbi:hypothetical protein LDENG_00220890 [Lucifuga dentata]|nr:hypothetical protein LDENG_00220890 [Lucifuga dentata]
MDRTKSFLCFSLLLSGGLAAPLAGKEAWGYVEVREGAHMFWWLYYAADTNLPLVMWLQVRHNTFTAFCSP